MSTTAVATKVFADPDKSLCRDAAHSRMHELRASPVYLPETPDFEDAGGDFLEFLSELEESVDYWRKEFPAEEESAHLSEEIYGSEVGDDRVDCTESHFIAASVLAHQSTTVGMMTSRKDTMISSTMMNFCEVTTMVPSSKSQLFNPCRKRGDLDDMQFIDAPALRTVIDTTKVENLHSTSTTGKASMLGAKLKSSNRTCRSYLQVANLLQDGMLRTAKSPEPKYIPNVLGGCNCPSPYEDPANVYLYMKAFKGGGYDRLYGTAVEEAKEAIRLTESGKPTTVILAKVLRDNDELAFGTFNQYVALPTPILDKMDEGLLPTPLYRAGGVINSLASCENRLRRAKKLVTKTEARVIANRANLIRETILTPVEITGAKEARRCETARSRSVVMDALHGHTAFMNLVRQQGHMSDLTKLIRDGWSICVTGQPEFKIEHAQWLHNGAKGETLSILDIPLDEDMYIRDEVSEDETMMISGIRLDVEGLTGKITQTTKSEVGLYQINKQMEDWSDDLLTKLREHPVRPVPREDVIAYYSEDREWVNDDSLIIQQAIVDFQNLDKNAEAALVSRDKRLANQLSIQANCRVVLIDPECLPLVYPEKTWNSTTVLTPREVYEAYDLNRYFNLGLKIPHRVYIDTGSLLSLLSPMVKEKEGNNSKYFKLKPIKSGTTESGKRFEVYDKVEIPFRNYLKLRVYDSSFLVTRGRRKPSHYSEGSGSSRYGWSDSNVTFEDYITRRMTSFQKRK